MLDEELINKDQIKIDFEIEREDMAEDPEPQQQTKLLMEDE